MSSKNKTTDTKEEAKLALVPKLRFPQFREAEGWGMKPLEECLGYQQPTPYLVKDERYNPVFKTPVLTAGKTFILGYTNEEHGIFTEGLPVIIFDDFTTATQFVDFPFKAKSSAMKILEPKNGADIKFMYEALQNVSFEVGAHERHWISTFAPMLVPVPQPAEQQKIADCLSSVDELMAAQARKVGALKTHKKGLMQQLFPREGETQPRLRFPEFQNTGEWEKKAIGDVFKVTRGEVLSMTLVKDEASDEAPFPVYSSQTKSKGLAGYYSEHLYEDAITWTTDGANAGDVNFRPGKFYCTNVCGVLINKRGYANACVAALLNSVTRSHVSYVGNPKLMNGVMTKIEIPFPSVPEQQRIGECLSTIDAIITDESKRLEALKTHKKGLMQHLFPASEEVGA